MSNPTDPMTLDRCEALIERTQRAGRMQEAFELYQFELGGYRHLAWSLGDNSRGFRILSAFSPDGTPEAVAPGLAGRERAQLLSDLGMFAKNVGNLDIASRALTLAAELFRQHDDTGRLSRAFQYQAVVHLLSGRIPAAVEVAAAAVAQAEKGDAFLEKSFSHAYLATALARQGDLEGARRHFATATELALEEQLCSLPGVWEAEFKMFAGDRTGATAQTRSNGDISVQRNFADSQARCDTLLGLLSLPNDPAAARQHLDAARHYASRSGNVEVQLRCHHLAAEIARAERAYDLARSEAEAGIHLADTCGFGHYSIELRLALARAQLDAGDPKAALQRAREALDRSVHPECQYAWGEADALHLCGVAHARLGELDLARTRLTAAVAKREWLTHPGLPDTRAELARLGGD